jgi:hypothetical protein
MERFETIKSLETANYRIDYAVAPDDDLDLSWDEDGSTARGLESGQYVAFVARVQVVHKPTDTVMGADYLGGCVYESPETFIRGSMYFRDMVSEACQAARENAKRLGAIRLRSPQS